MKVFRVGTKTSNSNGVFKWSVILVVIIILAFFVYVSVKIGQPLATDGSEEIFVVEDGAASKQVARQLEEAGFINHPFFFDLYVRFKGYAGEIQAGEYLVSSSMSVREIAKKFARGDAISDAVTLTVIEGWNISDIADALEELGVVSRQEFMAVAGVPRVGGAMDFSDEFPFLSTLPEGDTLEGFLFPDTYFISKEATAEEVVRKLLSNFDRKFGDELRLAVQNGSRDLYEIMTLASLVEREVGRNVKKGAALSRQQQEKLLEERAIVAGIFLNRLEIGMALQSDATISYITGNNSSRATIAETQISSPYNTYQNTGLPPGPIANPSLSAIEVAVNPTPSNYLFFLTSPDGTAYYAEDIAGHRENRERYLE